jgi:hypothetical protein
MIKLCRVMLSITSRASYTQFYQQQHYTAAWRGERERGISWRRALDAVCHSLCAFQEITKGQTHTPALHFSRCIAADSLDCFPLISDVCTAVAELRIQHTPYILNMRRMVRGVKISQLARDARRVNWCALWAERNLSSPRFGGIHLIFINVWAQIQMATARE